MERDSIMEKKLTYLFIFHGENLYLIINQILDPISERWKKKIGTDRNNKK